MADKQAVFFNVIGGLVTVAAAFVLATVIFMILGFFGVI